MIIRVIVVISLFFVVASCSQQKKGDIQNKEFMDTSLRATLQIRTQNGLWADLKIINQKDKTVEIFQPGNFLPITGWEYSNEAYQIAALQSFHILKMTIFDADGAELSQQELMTLADHAFRRIGLKPGDEMNLSIPLHEFYSLDSKANYTIVVQYGRDGVVAYAKTSFKAG